MNDDTDHSSASMQSQSLLTSSESSVVEVECEDQTTLFARQQSHACANGHDKTHHNADDRFDEHNLRPSTGDQSDSVANDDQNEDNAILRTLVVALSATDALPAEKLVHRPSSSNQMATGFTFSRPKHQSAKPHEIRKLGLLERQKWNSLITSCIQLDQTSVPISANLKGRHACRPSISLLSLHIRRLSRAHQS